MTNSNVVTSSLWKITFQLGAISTTVPTWGSTVGAG